MSTSAACSAVETRIPFLDRLARQGVLAGLRRMTDGGLTLTDACGTERFGAGDGGAGVRIEVHDTRFYRRAALGGSLAAGEAYVDGDWSCSDLTALFRLFVRNPQAIGDMDRGLSRLAGWADRFAHWCRRNLPARSRANIEAHYDLGNDFFRLFLDETLMYSSGIFPQADSTLYEASVEKIDRVCRLLDLRPDDHLLEIGTGWGGFAVQAARDYGCRVTTTTISREQFNLTRQRVRQSGLADRVEVLCEDYRNLTGRYDKLVSIEMIEAVGHQFYDTFFRKCGELLKPDGLMLLQGIVMKEQGYALYLRSVDFIQKYIFPGGCLPSVLTLGESAARATDLRLTHLEDFAEHYARTLRCWRDRFHAALDQVRSLGYPERFIRMWNYYLCYCEAAFEERYIGVVQMLFAKPQFRERSRSFSS